MNVTATEATAPGDVTVWPDGAHLVVDINGWYVS